MPDPRLMNIQPQPSFPQAAFRVTPDGQAAITIIFSPALTLTQVISEADMNAICAQWIESRKQLKRELQIVADVKRSRNG